MACRAGAHVADLVQEQGAAVALLELADAAPLGAGEGPLLVAEQLAFQQRLGDGGAVDGQERLVGPAAVVVQGPGHQFLAGAALAQDQHVDVLRGDPADGLAHLLHDRAAADDAVAAVLGRQHGRHVHQPGRLEGPVEHLAEAVEVHRLDQVIEGAALHGLDGRLGGAVGRDEDDRPFGVEGLDLLEDIQAGAVGQLQVEHDHVRAVLADLLQPFGGRRGGQHLDLVPLEDAAEGVADAFLVIDDQQGRHGSFTSFRDEAERVSVGLLAGRSFVGRRGQVPGRRQ